MAVDRTLLVLTCPACGQRMKAPKAAMGKTYKCVKCGEHVTVGEPNIEEAAGADTPPPSRDAQMHEPVGQLLLREGLVTREQLEEAFAAQDNEGGKTFENLIRLGHLDKDELHSFLSKQSGVAAIQLDRVQIDREVLQLIPRELALEHMLLPIDRLGKLLTVAMACPLDVATIAEMEKQTGLKVKAMLCRLDAIHLAVEKYYPSGGEGGAMATYSLPSDFGSDTPPDLGDKIGKLENLLVAPEFVQRLAKLAHDPESKAQDIALTASIDPALAAALLRTANSAAYGLPRQVDSVSLALTMLGRTGTAEVATACSNGKARSSPDFAPIYERARRASIAAAAIAKASGRVGRSVAHTSGLLHEVGRIALASASPEKYAKIDMNQAGTAVCTLEKRGLNYTHPDAAALLCLRWHLPNALCDALKFYLDPDSAQHDKDLASVVSLAASAAAAAPGVSPDTFTENAAALKILGLNAAAVAEAVKAALGES